MVNREKLQWPPPRPWVPYQWGIGGRRAWWSRTVELEIVFDQPMVCESLRIQCEDPKAKILVQPENQAAFSQKPLPIAMLDGYRNIPVVQMFAGERIWFTVYFPTRWSWARKVELAVCGKVRAW